MVQSLPQLLHHQVGLTPSRSFFPSAPPSPMNQAAISPYFLLALFGGAYRIKWWTFCFVIPRWRRCFPWSQSCTCWGYSHGTCRSPSSPPPKISSVSSVKACK